MCVEILMIRSVAMSPKKNLELIPKLSIKYQVSIFLFDFIEAGVSYSGDNVWESLV